MICFENVSYTCLGKPKSDDNIEVNEIGIGLVVGLGLVQLLQSRFVVTLILQSVRRIAVMSEITNLSSKSVAIGCSDGSCVPYDS